MSGRVLVLVPHGSVPDDAAMPEGCNLIEWHGAEGVFRALAGIDAGSVVVFATDGLQPGDLPGIVDAVRRCGAAVVEVRGAQWDGLERLELAAACKGVVSGFGVEAVGVVARALA